MKKPSKPVKAQGKPVHKKVKVEELKAKFEASKLKAKAMFEHEIHHNKEKAMVHEATSASVQPQPEGAEGVPPKREMTPAAAEEVLDRLHYCKKHGVRMTQDEHLAYHCEIDDKEKAAAEEAEAKEAWAVYSKAHPELGKAKKGAQAQ